MIGGRGETCDGMMKDGAESEEMSDETGES